MNLHVFITFAFSSILTAAKTSVGVSAPFGHRLFQPLLSAPPPSFRSNYDTNEMLSKICEAEAESFSSCSLLNGCNGEMDCSSCSKESQDLKTCVKRVDPFNLESGTPCKDESLDVFSCVIPNSCRLGDSPFTTECPPCANEIQNIVTCYNTENPCGPEFVELSSCSADNGCDINNFSMQCSACSDQMQIMNHCLNNQCSSEYSFALSCANANSCDTEPDLFTMKCPGCSSEIEELTLCRNPPRPSYTPVFSPVSSPSIYAPSSFETPLFINIDSIDDYFEGICVAEAASFSSCSIANGCGGTTDCFPCSSEIEGLKSCVLNRVEAINADFTVSDVPCKQEIIDVVSCNIGNSCKLFTNVFSSECPPCSNEAENYISCMSTEVPCGAEYSDVGSCMADNCISEINPTTNCPGCFNEMQIAIECEYQCGVEYSNTFACYNDNFCSDLDIFSTDCQECLDEVEELSYCMSSHQGQPTPAAAPATNKPPTYGKPCEGDELSDILSDLMYCYMGSPCEESKTCIINISNESPVEFITSESLTSIFDNCLGYCAVCDTEEQAAMQYMDDASDNGDAAPATDAPPHFFMPAIPPALSPSVEPHSYPSPLPSTTSTCDQHFWQLYQCYTSSPAKVSCAENLACIAEQSSGTSIEEVTCQDITTIYDTCGYSCNPVCADLEEAAIQCMCANEDVALQSIAPSDTTLPSSLPTAPPINDHPSTFPSLESVAPSDTTLPSSLPTAPTFDGHQSTFPSLSPVAAPLVEEPIIPTPTVQPMPPSADQLITQTPEQPSITIELPTGESGSTTNPIPESPSSTPVEVGSTPLLAPSSSAPTTIISAASPKQTIAITATLVATGFAIMNIFI